MKEYASEHIRNVLVAGHGGTGKTSLCEALLHLSGATSRLGSVADGTSLLDFEDEERSRNLSVSLAVAPVEWDNHKINLLDSPGYADFIGEVQAAMAVADAVLVVVSAVEGVEVQHEIVWRMADERGLPRIVFVNKLDRERASASTVIAQLTDMFGSGVAPMQVPIGVEHEFHGVVDLLENRAYTYADGTATESDVPAEVADDASEARGPLMEAIVENDEDLMERYFADEPIESKELLAMLAHGVGRGATFPVVLGSATRLVGVDRLADLLVAVAPSPLERPGTQLTDGSELDPGAGTAAFVYKTYADPFVGQVSYFKVVAGSVSPDVHLVNPRSHQDERLHQVFVLRGKDHDAVPVLNFGDFGAVAKLTDTRTGDTLALKGSDAVVAGSVVAEPVLAVAIAAHSNSDEDKLATAMHRLEGDDPSVRIERNPETHQTLLWGMGETHLSVTLERMKRKFGVDVDTSPPKVAYRETARGKSEFEGKHKKQSGGRGQYGVAHVRLEPRGRGEGYEFVDEVVGGAIPRQFISAVDKGIQEAMQKGPLAGFPVVDVRVIVDDGKHHSVDSDEHSFKMAGSLAFRGALSAAQPVLLEPVGRLQVLVPDTMAGDVSGDLNSRRGRLQGMESVPGGRQLITALVPMAEIARYAIDLRSLTGGRGNFSVDFDHYDEVPTHLLDKVMAANEED